MNNIAQSQNYGLDIQPDIEMRLAAVSLKMHEYRNRLDKAEQRIAQLEKPRDQQAVQVAMKETSVRAEADQLPPRRSDVAAIFVMKAFIERFLAYDDLGQCVPAVIRDDAREALGRARVEGRDNSR